VKFKGETEVLCSRALLFPGPDRGQEVCHVDPLAAHLDHPGVLEHSPGRGAAGGFFLETIKAISIEINSKMAGESSSFGLADIPALNKVLEIITPFYTRLRLVL
jgi:hypothetical protein